jgi:hypothetical protein
MLNVNRQSLVSIFQRAISNAKVSSRISLAELQLKNKRCGRLTVSCVATKTV